MQSSSDPETFNSEHWAKPNPEPLADAQPAKKKANFSIRQRCGDLEYYGSRDWMNASNAARHVSSRRGKTLSNHSSTVKIHRSRVVPMPVG
ncbi:hypothetical protein C343_01734 [Cryptococcus neoformans C23]|uniref:Uncharacterized protein n=1 Tax=Cryptococcus neoformans (strain H99 / ATCC 208821 / CBS 10515 / FGSC 9487) TaxID=235443 RepID=J9VML3_CRYN9|nr:hypothetical protein CNAG_07516 [Cryptococcus neoformans var. grubii H99]AUB23425.1 hypothetical protein CKF44_07516 [Cryptococcus neoformans var. grubii]OWZ34419.1 hypothetical protein C347_01803 [Cryptococcus neoformans var. grubii AD2-60a]OWZ46503.1 hypothetical protein C343_01734 [Cryptococcus neoformans var. grubii C23]OWZ49423.1 hypothetical protein C353_01750 [Cryptococcus neoformans var. grubii AD1-83a]OWZ55625.1 hypothetical protein C368_02565 [Cryptococcus neoformans var. grubii 1|eukprot:XP_012047878.1 hypothetical protein CNAG_07516 [Cryptococcus neoformans var. grubii H99]